MEHDNLGDADGASQAHQGCVALQPSQLIPPDDGQPQPEQHHGQAPRPCRALAPLLHLPSEILSNILSCLHPRYALAASASCRTLRAAFLSLCREYSTNTTPQHGQQHVRPPHELASRGNFLRSLRLPVSALPGRETAAALLPRLHSLTITGAASGSHTQRDSCHNPHSCHISNSTPGSLASADHTDSDDEWEEESGDRLYSKAHLLALRGWLRKGGWAPELPDPVPAASETEPLPSNGATPAVVTVAAATGGIDSQPRVECGAVCLSLRLDVDPWTAAALLLRLCPRARAVSCLCLMAGLGGHDYPAAGSGGDSGGSDGGSSSNSSSSSSTGDSEGHYGDGYEEAEYGGVDDGADGGGHGDESGGGDEAPSTGAHAGQAGDEDGGDALPLHTRQQQQQQQQGWNTAQTECTEAEKGGCGPQDVGADGPEAEAEVQVDQAKADLLRQRLRGQRLAAARLVFTRLAASVTSLELGCVRCLAALGAHCRAEAAAAEAVAVGTARTEAFVHAAGTEVASVVPRAIGTAQAAAAGEAMTPAPVPRLALVALAVQAHPREGSAGGGLGAGLGDLGDVDPGWMHTRAGWQGPWARARAGSTAALLPAALGRLRDFFAPPPPAGTTLTADPEHQLGGFLLSGGCSAVTPLAPGPEALVQAGPNGFGLTGHPYLHTLSLHGVSFGPALARVLLPPLGQLRALRLSHVTVRPQHPSGWMWLENCTSLTRLELLPGCHVSPHRLGLAHPALARLTALRRLHTCWALPREAPANLAPLTALTYLGAAGASSLPYVVPQALPSVRVLRVSCFFGGTPLGGHLAQLLPGLTELRAAEAQPPSLMQQLGLLEGADAEEETEAVHQQPQRQQEQGVKGVMAPAGASTHGLAMQTGAGDAQQQQCEQRELPPHHWSQQRMGLEGLGPGLWRDWQSWGPSAGPPGDGLGDEGFNALGVVGRAGSEVAGGAGAAGPGLPSAPAGPTASSSRSRVLRCVLPLDVGAVGRLHTYARLRALVLVGPGPAAALLEALRPLTGLTSLTLQWAQLPREGEEAGGDSSRSSSSSSQSDRDSDRSSDDAGSEAGSDLDELVCKAANGAKDGAHGLPNGPLAPAAEADAAAAHGARNLPSHTSDAPPHPMSPGPLPPPPLPAVMWARRVTALLPRLTCLTLDNVEGLTHDVLDALLLPPPSPRSQRPPTAQGTAPPHCRGLAGEGREGGGSGGQVCRMGAEDARKGGSKPPSGGGAGQSGGPGGTTAGAVCSSAGSWGGSGGGGLPCLRYLAVGDFPELCVRRLARLVEQRGGGRRGEGSGTSEADGGGGGYGGCGGEPWGWGCPLERLVLVGCGGAGEGEVQAALLAARRSSQLQLTWVD